MNPLQLDTRFFDKIASLEDRVASLERTRQPYVADWIQLSESEFGYSSATKISINNTTTSARFAVGDRLKLVQNSTTKYFLVTRVASNYIRIAGGTSYTFTNHSITEIYYSKNMRPSGFPQMFDYTPTFAYTYLSGSNTITEAVDKAEFTMMGNMTLLNLALGFGKSTSSPDPFTIEIGLPYTVDNTFKDQTVITAFGGGVGREFAEGYVEMNTSLFVIFPIAWAAFNGYLYATALYITQGAT